MRAGSSLAEGIPWDAGAASFADYAATAAGRLRFELTIETLQGHLPASGLRVLDVGCGLGGLAVWLAERGHSVVAIDPSREMLGLAIHRAAALPSTARQRLSLQLLSLAGAVERYARGSFDLVIAHTLLDYLADPKLALRQIVRLVAAGGLTSVVRVNHISEALRPALRGHLRQAWDRLEDARLDAALFGVAGNATTVEVLRDDLEGAGFRVVGTYGLRVVADYLPPEVRDDPSNWAALLGLERAFCTRPSCCGIGRYIHMVATRGA